MVKPAEADVSEQQLRGRGATFLPVETIDGVGLQRTVFGVGRGVDAELGAGVPQRAGTVGRVVGVVPLAFGTNHAADLEAGFRARNEEVHRHRMRRRCGRIPSGSGSAATTASAA